MALKNDPMSRYRRGMRTVPPLPPGDSNIQPARPHLEVRLPLTLLTPMIGGGVKALTPDRAVPIRPTAIRGALRWWWRVLNPEPDLRALREQEAEIFGGVNLPGERDTRASWLSVRVENVANLRKVPAGAHENAGGLPKTLPRWQLARGLDYALFPLQASIDERRNWQSAGNMPTKEVIDRLDFDLVLRIDRRWAVEKGKTGYAPGPGPDQDAIGKFLTAVQWWLHFGGVGARTRRGFGAVALREGRSPAVTIASKDEGSDTNAKARIDEALSQEWSGRLAGRPMLPALEEGINAPKDRPSLFGARLLLGPTHANAADAHGEEVALLKAFRQAPGLGRDPGLADPKRPGRSRWPEADLVKSIANNRPYKHPQHPNPTGEPLPAPRAAFGLPILIRFKDALDAKADADLVAIPPGDRENNDKTTDRWASPVILRPVVDKGAYRGAVLVLSDSAVPARVQVKVLATSAQKKPGEERPVRGFAGSRTTIHAVLQPAKGDALAALCAWLDGEGFKPVKATKPVGGR